MDNLREGKGNNAKIYSVRSGYIGSHHSNDLLASNMPSKETSKMCIKHPKLVKILNTMKQISPQRLARDKEQPASGCIQEILQRRLDKRVALAPASSDSSPNRAFLQLRARIEHTRASVLLNLCNNSRFMKSRMRTSD